MKVVLATGVPDLDNAIQQRITKAQFVGSALYKEAVVDVVERRKPDVIILSELLEGVLSTRELILTLRTRFPEVRIIYILKDENPKEKSFLYHWMIFDVFNGKFSPADLEEALFKPKTFKDVSHELEELKQFQTPTDLIDDEPDITGMTGINPREYGTLDGPMKGTNQLYQQIVAFWSVLDQSAKTFSAVNTSLILATNKDLKILLLDFNIENPNVHLQFGFSDPDRNLGAIVEDTENGIDISKENLDQYLITHPVYRNLKILPGYILKMKNRKPADVYVIFEKIIEAAQQSNYSTILVDTGSGLRDELTASILKKVNKILMHVTETPGSLYAVRRCFDTEVGPFVANLIDRKKVVPVIAKSYDDTRGSFTRALEATLETRIGGIIPHHEDVKNSVYNGTPLLSKKPPEILYDAFIILGNQVHKNIFRKPIKRKQPSAKKDKQGGLFGGVFGPKKK